MCVQRCTQLVRIYGVLRTPYVDLYVVLLLRAPWISPKTHPGDLPL